MRAISTAAGISWDKAYCELCAAGYSMADMPDANAVWGAVLRRHGFRRHLIPENCPECYTVEKFCEDHPSGVYVLALRAHVVAVVNGNYMDTWNSGEECPLYFWSKED